MMHQQPPDNQNDLLSSANKHDRVGLEVEAKDEMASAHIFLLKLSERI
jgi:hypothetical protein